MDAAQTTITTADAVAGFGLLSFYSSVADVATMVAAVVLVDSVMVVAVAVTTVTAVNGLSSFLFFSVVADAEITVPAAKLLIGVAYTAPSYILFTIYLTVIL